MKERSVSETIVATLGVVFGVVFWVLKMLISIVKEIVQFANGRAKTDSQSSAVDEAAKSASRLSEKAGRVASQGAEKARAAFDEARQHVDDESAQQATGDTGKSEGESGMDTSANEPDVAAEEMTDGADFRDVDATRPGETTTSEHGRLEDNQHQEIGGVPPLDGDDLPPEDDVLAGRDTLSISREPGSSDVSAFSYGAAPSGAPIDEGADDRLFDGDALESEVEEAAQLHEGIQSIDEPGATDATNTYADVNDSGPDMSEDDAFEQGADIGEAPFVTDGPETQEDIPAASRGLLDTDELIDEPSSTTGGEVDLVNDEADADENTGMTIVDSPDESLSADAVDEPITYEPTLGLRDSDSPDAPRPDDDENGSSGEHLGISGNFDQADEVETIPALPIDEDAGAESRDVDQADADIPGGSGSTADASTIGGDVDETLDSSFGKGTVVGEESADVVDTGAVDTSRSTGDPDAGARADTSGSGQNADNRSSRKGKNSDWLPKNAVRGDGSGSCPADYPIKGNANSRIYHRPTDGSYEQTVPEYCFATEEDAKAAGFRARKT